MIITEILARNCRLYPDKTALIERCPEKNLRQAISWKFFYRKANKLGHALTAMGVKKGDRVALLMTNCLEWLPVYFGILSCGALAVPLNFRFESDKIKLCTTIAAPRVFIFGPEFIPRIEAVKKTLDTLVESWIYCGPKNHCPEWARRYEEIIKPQPDEPPDVRMDILDDAALYFTSGTTGDPKGVLLTHRNLEHACYAENHHHRQTRDDIFLCIPPLYHTGAKMHWMGSFLVGGTSVLLKGVSPQWVIEAVSEEKATIVWLLVPWAHDILIAVETGEISLDQYNLDQWRLMHIGAQPVPKTLIEKWKTIFPLQEYDTNYGLTEATGPGCIHLGVENSHKVGAIGLPGFDWEAKIVDKTGACLPLNESGELVIRGPGVMKAYYNNPEATEKTLRDGWLFTGDVARYDRHGFIWLVDRVKDMIIYGGENIFPVEIEHFFMQHDSIRDIAVIGLPDERLGEIPAGIISPKPGHDISEQDIVDFQQQLPRYKQLKKIFFGEVPRNPTGKIEKPKLRRIYAPDRRKDITKLLR